MFCADTTAKHEVNIINNKIKNINNAINAVNVVVDKKNKNKENIMDVKDYILDLTYKPHPIQHILKPKAKIQLKLLENLLKKPTRMTSWLKKLLLQKSKAFKSYQYTLIKRSTLL